MNLLYDTLRNMTKTNLETLNERVSQVEKEIKMLRGISLSEFFLQEVFSLEEAAEYLKTEPKTLGLYAKRKKISYSIVGKNKVFRRDDLNEFLERNSKLHTDIR